MKYKIVVDYGRPYDINVNTEDELKTELKKLKSLAKLENPFFDVWVFDEKDKDVTNEVFKNAVGNRKLE